MPIPTNAQPWDEIFRRDGRVFDSPAPVVLHVADVLQEHGCRRVVDLGCGSGRHTVFLAQRGFDVIGIDNSPTALSLTREWLMHKGLHARLARADMRRPLPLPNGICDGVISTQVIHHALLATVCGTAREISRILQPGGVLLVSVPSGTDPEETFMEIEPGTFVPTSGKEAGLPHHIFSAEELGSLFPGYNVLELDEIGGRIWALLAIRRPGHRRLAGAARRP
jgi:SAM-dependent methyltransferase